MSGLVFACIAPHGGEVIAELAGENIARSAKTRKAMEELGRRMAAAQPETIIVVTPHGVRVAGAICIMTTERASGVLVGEGGQGHIEIDMPVDRMFGIDLDAHASGAYGINTVTAIYGASGGDSCYTSLDWGAVVPLWFLGARWHVPPDILSITPSRDMKMSPRKTLEDLYLFGRAIAEVAEASGRRVALIASADWGHAHDPNGPYGYDPASAEFDAMIVETVKANALDTLLDVDIDFADKAKIDGLWQAVILAGALNHTPMRGELLSYEAPTYFGMLVASYSPD